MCPNAGAKRDTACTRKCAELCECLYICVSVSFVCVLGAERRGGIYDDASWMCGF
jgi:hypothetical protein